MLYMLIHSCTRLIQNGGVCPNDGCSTPLFVNVGGQLGANYEVTFIRPICTPAIKFGNSRSGKPTYEFWTGDDTGAGANFKGLIIFDLALLRLTELPVIAHDSNIFKNIADLPIDKIMELYNQSEKQIFIAFDKEDTFYDVTRDIVYSTKIIELHENGGELFGWSWAKKAAREKQIATETGVIEES